MYLLFLKMIRLRDADKWLYTYSLASSLSNVDNGSHGTVVGPTQLYLARRLGVTIEEVNFGYSFFNAGVLVGATLAGFLFKK